ncbi:hypothetical protein CEXT_750241 [Caerostris extrusa]|uniref:Uncharacterized protein n=1 Tax=Caerostris extrusa TaxID=172846 RepID=A0AAV4Y1C2_CAEEX|nr:hypothetical protein CEXT_750241 [Caerostris extrusa]
MVEEPENECERDSLESVMDLTLGYVVKLSCCRCSDSDVTLQITSSLLSVGDLMGPPTKPWRIPNCPHKTMRGVSPPGHFVLFPLKEKGPLKGRCSTLLRQSITPVEWQTPKI